MSRVVQASVKAPCLALTLKIEMSLVRQLLSRKEILAASKPSDHPAMATSEITPEFLSACCRLLSLFDAPQDIPFLSRPIQQEILYRVLKSAAGARLGAIAGASPR